MAITTCCRSPPTISPVETPAHAGPVVDTDQVEQSDRPNARCRSRSGWCGPAVPRRSGRRRYRPASVPTFPSGIPCRWNGYGCDISSSPSEQPAPGSHRTTDLGILGSRPTTAIALADLSAPDSLTSHHLARRDLVLRCRARPAPARYQGNATGSDHGLRAGSFRPPSAAGASLDRRRHCNASPTRLAHITIRISTAGARGIPIGRWYDGCRP